MRITGFQGALSSRATVQQMTIADAEGVWLTLNGVTLDWNRAAVLRGEFSVNELSASEVIVARPPVAEATLPSPEAKGFSLPQLPISVSIGTISAARVELGPAVLGQAVDASLQASMRLANGEGQAQLSLLRLDEGPAGRVTLDASYSNTSRLLVLDLDAHEGSGGIAAQKLGLPGAPATDFAVTGQEIIDDFAADIRLATDGVDRLSGRVTLAEEQGDRLFTATLGGNPAPLFVPEYAAFFGEDVALDLAGRRLASGALDLSRLSVRTRALTLDGTLSVGADRLPARFALTGRIGSGDGSPVLLPLAGAATRVAGADIALSYDAAQDAGWSGSAAVQGLQRDDLAVDQIVLNGSGQIRGGPMGGRVGATLRLVAAGLRPADPALSQALGEAVTGEMQLAWQEGKPVKLSDLTVAGSDYVIRTLGTISGLGSGIGLDGQVSAEVSDLTRFSGLAKRPLGGTARLDMTGRGSLLGGDLDLTGSVSGEGLSIGQAEVDALLSGPARVAFSVARGTAGTEVRQLDLTASTLSVGLTGWLRSAGSDLSATLRFDDLAALGGPYRGKLTGTARVTGTPEAGRLQLDAVAEGLAVGQAEADLLLRGRSTLTASVRREAGVVRVDALELRNPQVGLTAKARTEGPGPTLDLEARLTDLGVLLPEFPGTLSLAGTATEASGGYRLDLQAKGPGRIDARVAGTVQGGRADLGLTGTAQAALANPFIKPRSISGPLRFDLRLNGPVALSSLSGRVSLSEGRLSAPVLRLALQGMTAEAVLANGSATVSADAASAAGGRVGLNGKVALQPPLQADLTVTPRAFVLRDPDLYETTVNGELRVTGPLTGGATISGRLTLPETEIRVPSTAIGGPGGIPDLIHRNESAAVRATRARAGLLEREERERTRPSRPYALALVIDAPNRVFVRGRGLDAELGGTLRLGGTTDAVVPSGGIGLIRGRLDILGRRLDLSEAQLTVQGSLDPSLRVVASNSSDGVTSSVTIEGRISQPEISFTSSPPLPDEEVLAHLLFGRNLTSLSPFQALQLANAVATLAGRGGDGLIGNLRRAFGLDDLDVGTDAGGGTSLRLGRYIAKNVYTDVEVGSQGTTQLNLNLDVRPGVTVRGSADSAGNTGIGVFVEQDY